MHNQILRVYDLLDFALSFKSEREVTAQKSAIQYYWIFFNMVPLSNIPTTVF